MARYSFAVLEFIHARHRGRCHLCGGEIDFGEYGSHRHDSWEVDHDRPRARGGSDRLTNLRAAHRTCNRSKQDLSSTAFRRSLGISRAPLTDDEYATQQVGGAVLGALVGGIIVSNSPAPEVRLRGILIGGLVGLAFASAAD